MKIAIVGTGYVGLVSGTCFSETGITVTCVDIDKDKISMLKDGNVPIYEPGLSEMVKRNVESERLSFSDSLKDSLENVDIIFIAVGTPPGEDGSADLQYVLAVAKEVGENINDYVLLVTKSTVPVGTSEKVRETVQAELDKRGSSIDFDVASNPEFLKEGDAINDFMKPDRVVVGVDSDKAKKLMERLYHAFSIQNYPVVYMDIASAEMTKYAANAMLATRISFMNDIANLCELVGADIDEVKRGIGSDSRIGKSFLNAGCGYGGSCFPKDVKALVKIGKENFHELEVLQAVESVNEKQKHVLFDKISNRFKGDLKDKTFAVWGLSFKPKTDDMREAPSLVLIEALLSSGAKVKVYDPVAMKETKKILGDRVEYADGMYSVLRDCDALVLVTEWQEFKVPKFTFIERELKQKLIFDGRNIYDPSQMNEFGFEYYSIGRK
ncbi:MAG: UDP-glucose/GDP-mannose dehydrogenase family protein [Marinifilaceae bacterium]